MKYDNKSIAERGLWVVLILGITFVLGWYPIDMFAGVMVMLFAIQSLFRGFNGEGKYQMVYQLYLDFC